MDEAGYNFNLTQKRAWYNKGEKLICEIGDKSINYSVTGAVMNGKFIAYTVNKKSNKREYFCYFLYNLNVLLASEYRPEDIKYVLDNAEVHKADKLIEMLLNDLNIIYLPPYSL